MWGFGCDSCLDLAKLLVGGHYEERVRKSHREQRQIFNFHLSLRVIIRFELDPVTLLNWPCAPGKQLILFCFDILYNEEYIEQEWQPGETAGMRQKSRVA